MRELDAFPNYPVTPRKANRTILNRIAAAPRDREFYDGDRMNGYGGMANDGRWAGVAENLIRVYGLGPDSQVLQIGCHKGFLLAELLERGINVRGVEMSDYAIECAPYQVKPFIRSGVYTHLPFGDKEFDLVLAVSPVYQLALPDAMKCLREIGRVGKGHSFITLGAYEDEADYWLLSRWFILAATVLSKADWLAVLNACGYEGDFRFDTAASLGLK